MAVARERLERHGVSTLSVAELLATFAGPNGDRTADAALDDLARIDSVTPGTAAVITAAVCNRHAADDAAVAAFLTTAQDIHRITVAFSAGRISTPP